MTVRVLRNIISGFHGKISAIAIRQFKARRAGFPVNGPNKDLLIISILCEVLLETNEPLIESSNARKPDWMSTETFNSLITKITLT